MSRTSRSAVGLASGRALRRRAAAPSAATNFLQPASVALPGPRNRMDGAGGLQRLGGAPCCSRAQAARGRSASTAAAEQPAAQISLGRAQRLRLRLALLGLATGVAGLVLATGLGLLFTSAVFGYPSGGLG